MLSSCANTSNDSKASSNSDTAPNTETTYSTEESSSESSVAPETTKETRIGYFGEEVVVSNASSISIDDWYAIHNKCGLTLLLGIGFDNPKLLEVLRDYYKDDDLTLSDVNYMQVDELMLDGYSGDQFAEINMGRILDLDFVRYILAENGLRLWVDEIPFAFFEENFPELVEKYNMCNLEDLFNMYNSYSDLWDFVASYDENHENAYSSFVSDGDEKALEWHRIWLFEALKDYNIMRLVFTDDNTKDRIHGKIDIVETIDGKNVYDFDDSGYESLSRRTRELYHCENVIIGEVETLEQLKESGINVDLYQQVWNSK